MIRDPLAMRFTQIKGGGLPHVRTCEPLFLILGTAGRIALNFGRVMDEPAMHFMHVTSWVLCSHVLMCTPLFNISESSGRIMQKFGVLLDPLTMRLTQAISGG